MSYLLLMTSSINRIQAQQHRWKKYINHKEEYVEKQISFDYFPWDYHGQTINF